MINGWQHYFFKELEKTAVVGFLAEQALNLGFTATGINESAKANNEKTNSESTMEREESLQLPGTSGMNFEGSKRIDPVTNSAVNKF